MVAAAGLRLPDIAAGLAAGARDVGSHPFWLLSLQFAVMDSGASFAILCAEALMPGTFAKMIRTSVPGPFCFFLAAVISFLFSQSQSTQILFSLNVMRS